MGPARQYSARLGVLRRTQMNRTIVSTGLVVLLAAMTTASAAKKEPDIQSGPNAEVTFDGLHRVDNTKFRYVWAKPGVDLSSYNKIMAVEAGFHYRNVRDPGGTSVARQRTQDFPIAEKNRAKFESIVKEVFQDEMGKLEHWKFTDQPGPDTIILFGSLYDIVSHVPPEYKGRGTTYISRVGEATLVLQIEDSLSREVLARVAERRAANPVGNLALARSGTVTSIAEVRRLARHWARKLRTALESLKE